MFGIVVLPNPKERTGITMSESPEELSQLSHVEPYKDEEFEKFIETIEGDTVEHWVNIASALGVARDTIVRWKKHPKAKEAIQKGIDRAMRGMEMAGSKDWRMYEAKLKMLGADSVQKIDITSGGEKLPIMGGTADVPKD